MCEPSLAYDGPPPAYVTLERDPVAAFRKAHADDVPVALPTSGTGTGTPRYVVRDTRSWVDSFRAYSERTGVGVTSVLWLPGLTASTMYLFAAVHADWAGARVTDDPRGATHAVLTPARLQRHLAQDPEAASGRTVVTAGDRLPAPVGAAAADADITLAHYYGAAELSFVGWGTGAEDLELFDEVEAEVRAGELWVRSPWLFRGYDGTPGRARRAADGFVTVGDLARLDGTALRVTGRGEDVVVTGGATVLVADVEDALAPYTSGGLLVCGLPHDHVGEVLACVVTEAADIEALRRAARVLPAAARPRRWAALPELPLTRSGKIDRAGVRERATSTGLPWLTH